MAHYKLIRREKMFTFIWFPVIAAKEKKEEKKHVLHVAMKMLRYYNAVVET